MMPLSVETALPAVAPMSLPTVSMSDLGGGGGIRVVRLRGAKPLEQTYFPLFPHLLLLLEQALEGSLNIWPKFAIFRQKTPLRLHRNDSASDRAASVACCIMPRERRACGGLRVPAFLAVSLSPTRA